MDEFSYEPYIYRGILGGVIGHLSVVILGAAYIRLYFGYDKGVSDMLLVGGMFGLIVGAIAGCGIGFILWRVTVKLGKEPKAVVRFLLGAAVFLGFSLLPILSAVRASYLIFSLAVAALGGGVPGLLAHSKNAISVSTDTRNRA